MGGLGAVLDRITEKSRGKSSSKTQPPPSALYLVGSSFAPVDADTGRALPYPPVHVHHLHVSHGVAASDAHVPIFEVHGNSGCAGGGGAGSGMACLRPRMLPPGTGMRVTKPLVVDFECNDVRPAGSPRLTYYVEMGFAYVLKPPASIARKLSVGNPWQRMGPGTYGIPLTRPAALWFEHRYRWNGRFVPGTQVFHTHATRAHSLWVFSGSKATLASLGLAALSAAQTTSGSSSSGDRGREAGARDSARQARLDTPLPFVVGAGGLAEGDPAVVEGRTNDAHFGDSIESVKAYILRHVRKLGERIDAAEVVAAEAAAAAKDGGRERESESESKSAWRNTRRDLERERESLTPVCVIDAPCLEPAAPGGSLKGPLFDRRSRLLCRDTWRARQGERLVVVSFNRGVEAEAAGTLGGMAGKGGGPLKSFPQHSILRALVVPDVPASTLPDNPADYYYADCAHGVVDALCPYRDTGRQISGGACFTAEDGEGEEETRCLGDNLP